VKVLQGSSKADPGKRSWISLFLFSEAFTGRVRLAIRRPGKLGRLFLWAVGTLIVERGIPGTDGVIGAERVEEALWVVVFRSATSCLTWLLFV